MHKDIPDAEYWAARCRAAERREQTLIEGTQELRRLAESAERLIAGEWGEGTPESAELRTAITAYDAARKRRIK